MLKLNDPKQLQQITDAANGHLTRQITRQDMAQRRQEAQEAKQLTITREAVNKSVAELYFKGKLTQEILDKHKDSRDLDDSTYATYSGKIHVDFQKRKDAYREILAKEFSLPPFESKVNPMDPNIAARTAANVQRHYLELVDKGGWDPAEASREAANLGRRINISAITMPEGLGLDEGDRYKPARIQSKLQEIADRVRAMTPEQRQQALPVLGPKVEILKNLSIANRFWASQAVDRDQKFQEQVDEVTKQEQAAETSRQQAATMKAQQEQQKRNPSGGK